jgi:cell division inhibitor SulA
MRNNYTFNNNEFSYNKQRSINGLSLLNVKKIHDDTDYQNEILTICDQFKANKQWILMINPNDKSLIQLAQNNQITHSKILRVNGKKTNVQLSAIEQALSKGNCAAVVLCDTLIDDLALAQLQLSAEKGNTHCFILENTQQLH